MRTIVAALCLVSCAMATASAGEIRPEASQAVENYVAWLEKCIAVDKEEMIRQPSQRPHLSQQIAAFARVSKDLSKGKPAAFDLKDTRGYQPKGDSNKDKSMTVGQIFSLAESPVLMVGPDQFMALKTIKTFSTDGFRVSQGQRVEEIQVKFSDFDVSKYKPGMRFVSRRVFYVKEIADSIAVIEPIDK